MMPTIQDSMTLPPLYKYLDTHGAKLTLGNRTFRHARPSDFNDTEDLTVQSIFPEEVEVALEIQVRSFPDILSRNVDRLPTCSSPMREQVIAIQRVIRGNPNVTEILKEEMAKNGVGDIFDVEHMRARTQAFIKEINDFLQGYRVLCVTTQNDSERMWERYAEQGRGVALRITPNLEKDSKFRLFRPVNYGDTRPPLYNKTQQFVEDSMFADREEIMRAMLDKIIYAKTREWEYECEYRLAIPLGASEEPWDTLPYHPEEITELYIGSNTVSADMEELVALGYSLNPEIKILQMLHGPSGSLTHREVTGR